MNSARLFQTIQSAIGHARLIEASGVWDLTTLYSGAPSGSSSSFVPVVGPGTQRPIGFTIHELFQLRRAKVLKITGENAWSDISGSRNFSGLTKAPSQRSDGGWYFGPGLFHWGSLQEDIDAELFIDTITTNSPERELMIYGSVFTTLATIASDVDSKTPEEAVDVPNFPEGLLTTECTLDKTTSDDAPFTAGITFSLGLGAEVFSGVAEGFTNIYLHDDLYWPVLIGIVEHGVIAETRAYYWSLGDPVVSMGTLSILGKTCPLYRLESLDISGAAASMVVTIHRTWPHDPGDGGGPIWNTTTGEKLRPNYSF